MEVALTNLELNREYPEPGEASLIEEMVKVAVERMVPQQGRIRRGQHAKPTGCVRGVFTIRDDIPDDLRYGVFRQPNRSFQAIVRFSNSAETMEADGKAAARGIAVRLLDVDGAPAIPGADQRYQDFLAVNHPVFPFATPAEYLKVFNIRAAPLAMSELLTGAWLVVFGRRNLKIVKGILGKIVIPATLGVGDLLAGAWLSFSHPRHLKSLLEIIGATVASPLVTYWSGSPYWLGPPGTTGGHAVKYSLVPRFEGAARPGAPNRKSDDYLSQTLKRYLKKYTAVFEFRVQLQTDPVTMPVEDVSVEWDEAVSKPIPLAILTIGVQDVDFPEGRALAEECEAMAFSPWNALAEHRPMGGINRLRQSVYLASQAMRAVKKDNTHSAGKTGEVTKVLIGKGSPK